MNLPLTGYEDIELLRATAHTRVFGAVRRSDGLGVVAKVFSLGDDVDELEARVEHEFVLLSRLDVEGVVRPLALERSGDEFVLLLERVPGVDLATHVKGQVLGVERFVALAEELAELLGRVHAAGVIHRDVKPTNILVEAETERLYLADFGISVLLERARRDVHDRALIEGTLPYLSPEQTGRTSRRVDVRSDLYSLGVSFYELLAGRRPFAFDEPLELIHAHLARQPTPLRELRPELPEVLDRIVAKLMAKDPDARYQTARALAADLRRVRARLTRGLSCDALELGADDRTTLAQFAPVHEVRARELAELGELIAEAPRCERGQLCVLSGVEGMGKAALIDGQLAELTLTAGHLGRGSFAEQRAATKRPYAAIVEALAGIAGQLLTRSETELGRWRERLDRALGDIGALITELVPDFEAILGPRPPLPRLDPHAARNRTQIAMTRFVAALVEPERPLVLVVEHLDRADDSSLDLLAAILGTPACAPLLILATCEAPSELPALAELLAGLGPDQLTEIELGPLDDAVVEQLLAATLARPPAELRPLQRLLARKTNNNPLLLRQLLIHLVDIGQLRYDDTSEGGWTWDPELGAAVELPDDFRGLLARRLDSLGPAQTELLCAAACVGAQFELGRLAALVERPVAELLPALAALTELGLIDLVESRYRFAHPTVRDTALAALDPERAAALHWRLAQLLLDAERDHGRARGADALYALAEHLVASAPTTRSLDLETRVKLSEQLVRAGRLALTTAAYESATHYLALARALLSDASAEVRERGSASDHYALVVELHHLHAQLLGVADEVEAAGEAFAALLDWPLDVGERGRIASSRLLQLHLAGRSREAVDKGVALLAEFGCRVPRAPSWLRTRLMALRAWLAARSLELDDLCALPPCEDPRAGAVMDILDTIKTASYVVDPRMYVVLVATHVRWFLARGMHPSAPLAVAQLAVSVAVSLGRVEDATHLADRGVALAARVSSTQLQVRTICAASMFVAPLGRPFAEPLARMRAVYPRALEAGDLLWASYTGTLSVSMHLEVGTHLTVVRRLAGKLERELGDRAAAEARLVARSLEAFTRMLGDTEAAAGSSRTELRPALDPEQVEAAGGGPYSVCVTTAHLALARLLLGFPGEALELCLTMHEDMEQVLFGSWILPRTALTLLASAALVRIDNPEALPPAARSASRRASALIIRWARGSDENYGHYASLARGLAALERDRDALAMRELEQARASAASSGCRWLEGLAAEFLARVASQTGLSGLVRGALVQAYEAYEAWGARAKLEQLRTVHAGVSGLFEGLRARAPSPSLTNTWTGARTGSTPVDSSSALDYHSVLGSVASITTTLRVDEVVANVLDAALTNAGGDHGFLVLVIDDAMHLVAELELDASPELLDPPLPLSEAGARVPVSLLRFVRRTGEGVVVDDAGADPRFRADPYVVAHGSRSLLAVPIHLDGRVLGLLALENRQSRESFSPERFEALQLILAQAARALEHARTHDALRDSELRWRSLVDQAPDLIALFDERGELEFVNRSPSPSALAHAEVLARIASSPAAERWAAALAEVLTRGTRTELELELPATEHQLASWWIARLAPIEADSASIPRKAIVIATDITERRQAEVQRTQLQSQLRQQQRLESLGTLASGVAHEINNPLQGIINYAELLEDSRDDPSLVGEFAHEIHVEAERVAAIVHTLLTFSRKEQPQPLEAADLHEPLASTLTLVRSVMRKDGILLEVEIPDELPLVWCRPQQIRQVLLNLVTNARDALNSAYPKSNPRKRISIRAAPRDELLVVTVEDWGPGIPPDVLPHIFDPFFTTKGRDQGTGLGLALALGIVQDHGGELRVDSRPGEGTRFELALPCRDGPSSA